MSTIVTLTDSAKEHMTTMLKENSKKAVRLALKGGGCAGFKYDWSLEDKVADDDEVVDFEKGKFVFNSFFMKSQIESISSNTGVL